MIDSHLVYADQHTRLHLFADLRRIVELECNYGEVIREPRLDQKPGAYPLSPADYVPDKLRNTATARPSTRYNPPLIILYQYYYIPIIRPPPIQVSLIRQLAGDDNSYPAAVLLGSEGFLV
jgi:hypothetical protein